MTSPGICCLETDWYGDWNRSATVRPILELVGQGWDRKPAFVHRDIATREELVHYLRRWSLRGARRFPILYLAFHGAPGRIYVGSDHRKRGNVVTLDDIAATIGPRRSGRLVHFGACSTLAIDRRQVKRFIKHTGVVAVSGFAKDLDWQTSSAFEVLILATLLRYSATIAGARRMDRALRRVSYLRRELAFRMQINGR